MKSCPPCHGECNQGRTCPAESHPAYESWVNWFLQLKTDIKATRYMFAKSANGRAYRAGWDAANNRPQVNKDTHETTGDSKHD